MPNLARISYYLFNAIKRLKWEREKLEKYKVKRLRSVVKYAYEKVPFYHKLFRASGIHPEDIKRIQDLNRLPIVRKKVMRQHDVNDLISKDFTLRKLKRLTTGGSTGEPFSIYICGREDDWRKAIYLRANISCGQRPRDRWVALDVAERAVETTFLNRIFGIFAREIVPVTWDKFSQIQALVKLKPDVLDGLSSALRLLAREVEARNIISIRPRIIFGTGDLIDKASRNYLEKVFHAPFYDQFGCAEVDRTAWQCPEKTGYHIDEDSVIMQFVDKDGEEVAPGERGEIVYTSLFNYAMPLIRYGVMDVGVPMDEECPCGNKLSLMKVIEGRSNSFLVFPGGHIVPPMSFIEILKAFELTEEIDQYRVFQKSENHVEIFVKKLREDVDEDKIRSQLLANIFEGLPKIEKVDPSSITFEVKFVDDFPMLGRGKLNVIISQVSAF
ncbi:MAG: phenylacetate--CoA ligase family protein [Candidatus Bathyarchaeia archaeon]